MESQVMQAESESGVCSVSVIMTVFNAGPYFGAALESILTQEFEDFEVLLHDDGSTDGSLKTLEYYAANDSRVHLSSDINRGISGSRNRLVPKARGRYLMMMDADDISWPQRMSQQVAFLDSHPDVVAIGSCYRIIDAEDRPIVEMDGIPLTHEEIDQLNMNGSNTVPHPTSMIRRDAFEEVGGYNEEYEKAEDLDLFLRLAEIGKLANLPQVLLSYRIHSGSQSGSNVALQEEVTRRVCECAWKRRGVRGNFQYRQWRMGEDRASRLEFHLRYGWWAWQSDFRDSWWYYAFEALKIAPWSLAAWKLLVFGALRRPAKREK